MTVAFQAFLRSPDQTTEYMAMARTGRPRKNVEYLSVTLPTEQVLWLKRNAKLIGIPVSHLVATLIDPHIVLARLTGQFSDTEEESGPERRIDADETITPK